MNIKFTTTFSKTGYHVYGKSWIDSFSEFTKDYPNITAKIYVDGMDDYTIKTLTDNDKIEIVDFDQAIPAHKSWQEEFEIKSTHVHWNKGLAVKFSFKSFVMINELKNNNDDIVIWLDADSIFKSYDFDNFPTILLENKFMACQKEDGSEHVESGIIIFNTSHPDKKIFLEKFESFYMNPDEYNSFGQFFDGYAIYRTLATTTIPFIDLNKGYGIGGIQSDPTCTFMNPEINKRFLHNIGITGKRSYDSWQQYAQKDKFFKLIHGNEVTKEDKLTAIEGKLSKLLQKRQQI